MTLRNYRSFVFDMDGTLTCAVHDFDAIRRAIDIPEGLPILESLAKMPKEEARPRYQKLEEIELELAKTATASPGAVELLEALRQNGRNVGIVTRNSRLNVEITLRAAGLERFFRGEHICTRDNAKPKPHPDALLHLFSLFGHKPELGVMVGDYLFDMECGRRAGAHTVHYAMACGSSWPEVTDLRVTSFAELLTHL